MLKLADSNVQFTTICKRSHITGGGPQCTPPGVHPHPAGAGECLCPYGSDVMPSDSKYRLSSIHDRHIFDSMRVAMASFFDLNVRNVQDVVSTRSTRADIICVALVT